MAPFPHGMVRSMTHGMAPFPHSMVRSMVTPRAASTAACCSERVLVPLQMSCTYTAAASNAASVAATSRVSTTPPCALLFNN